MGRKIIAQRFSAGERGNETRVPSRDGTRPLPSPRLASRRRTRTWGTGPLTITMASMRSAEDDSTSRTQKGTATKISHGGRYLCRQRPTLPCLRLRRGLSGFHVLHHFNDRSRVDPKRIINTSRTTHLHRIAIDAVKGGVKPDHKGGVKVDQWSSYKIRDCREGGRLERRPAPPERRRV